MRSQVVFGHGVERPVAKQQRELGEVVAKRIDLPPDEHVGVDPDARPGVQRRRAGEEHRGSDRLTSQSPCGELIEEPLHPSDLPHPPSPPPTTPPTTQSPT